MKIKSAEEIFIEEAKADMTVFDKAGFKRRFKTLFSVIMKANKRYAEQFIDLAATSAMIVEDNGYDPDIPADERFCSYSGGYIRDEHYVEVDKQSILKLKDQII